MKHPRIEITNRQSALNIDTRRVRQAVQSVLRGEGRLAAEVNVVIVNNAEIQAVNRKFLHHDFATDVISFSLGEADGPLEGELMVSAEKSLEMAPRFGWSPHDELELYVIHGTLHLVGFDDVATDDERVMRERETHYLTVLGIDVTHRLIIPSAGGSENTNSSGGTRS